MDGLPPMFALEDFYECEKQKGIFCKAEISIKPHDLNATLAEEIKKSHEIPFRFYRSSLYRMICIPKENTDTAMVKGYMRRVVGNELNDYNLTVEISKYFCNVNRGLNIYDYLICLITLAYIWLLYKATTYDAKRRKTPENPISKYDKWLKIFSIRENWEKINAENTNPDFQKLKSIQGIRFFTTILIITFHTMTSFLNLFLDNPEDLEQTFTNKLLQSSFQMDLFIIQIYFMISTFLLTNEIYELHKEHGYFSLMHCIKMYINRIFRFLPTMGIMILLTFPTLKIIPQGTIVLDYINMTWDSCINSWWATLLHISYLYNFSEICMPGTWLISVDTFIWLTTMILLYVQLKYKLNIKTVLAITFAATTFNFACIIYFGNLSSMYRPGIESIRRIFDSSDFQKLYISPFSSWNTGCIGIAMGAIYFHTKNKKIEIKKALQLIWLLTFLLVPVLVVYVSTCQYDGVNGAIVGSLLKPIFTIAFGIGILGMSRGLGGIIKTILEWDVAVKMGMFSYCTYLFHFFLIFSRGAFNRGLAHYKSFHIVTCLFQDVALSFMVGILTTLIFEQPGVTLQKMYIPQIKKPENKNVEECAVKEAEKSVKVE